MSIFHAKKETGFEFSMRFSMPMASVSSSAARHLNAPMACTGEALGSQAREAKRVRLREVLGLSVLKKDAKAAKDEIVGRFCPCRRSAGR